VIPHLHKKPVKPTFLLQPPHRLVGLEGPAAHGEGTAKDDGSAASRSGGGAAEGQKREFIAESWFWCCL